MRYLQLMQTTRFVVFQLANFFSFFFSGKYLIKVGGSFCHGFSKYNITTSTVLSNQKLFFYSPIVLHRAWYQGQYFPRPTLIF